MNEFLRFAAGQQGTFPVPGKTMKDGGQKSMHNLFLITVRDVLFFIRMPFNVNLNKIIFG